MDAQSAREELKFIKQIIEESRRTFEENGFYFMFWGGAVVACSVMSFSAMFLKARFLVPWIWGSFFPAAFLFLLFYHKKFPRHEKIVTFSSKIYKSVWQAILISSVSISLCGAFKPSVPVEVWLAVISAIMGIAYFICGSITGFTWMKFMSFGWWLGMIILFFMPVNAGAAVLTIMVLFFEFIPGIHLHKTWKKRHVMSESYE